MTVAIALAVPTWSVAANLLNAAADLIKVVVWPVFCAVVLVVWRKHVTRAFDAFIQRIPDLREGNLPGVGFKLRERRTPPGTGTRMLGRRDLP
jgi:hypothetical protein